MRQCYLDNRIMIIFLLILIIASWANLSFSCTSFAVYSGKILYGMNFDYPNVEMSFAVTQYNSLKIFQLCIVRGGQYASVCGMNENGIFCSIQMLFPEVTNWPPRQANDFDLWEIYQIFLSSGDSLYKALNFFDTTSVKIIHIDGTTHHDFFADKYGKAFVLEVGEEENLITKVENDFMVMTNFPIHQFAGKALEEIYGVGADRYKKAYEYIQENKASFDFNHGIETLKRSAQSSGSYPTQCSLLFDPDSNNVFIVLKRDFTKVWKISIEEQTIETFQGFDRYLKIPFQGSPILASGLMEMTSMMNASELIPNETFLYQNYPNPFNSVTSIRYQVPTYDHVKIFIYNLVGQKVRKLINEKQLPGTYSITWDGFDDTGLQSSSGVYFCKMKASDFVQVRKLILIQ